MRSGAVAETPGWDHRRGVKTGTAIALLAAVILGIAAFYFGVYDTAVGRCNRGDASACAIALLEHPTPPPAPSVGPWQCSLAIQGTGLYADVTGPENGCDAIEAFGLPQGVPSGAAFVWGGNTGHPAGSLVVCDLASDTTSITVYDTGLFIVGYSFCNELRANGYH